MHQHHATCILQLSTLGNLDRSGGLAAVGTVRLNLVHNVKSFDDLAKDNMLPIKPGGIDGANEDWLCGSALKKEEEDDE